MAKSEKLQKPEKVAKVQKWQKHSSGKTLEVEKVKKWQKCKSGKIIKVAKVILTCNGGSLGKCGNVCRVTNFDGFNSNKSEISEIDL